MLFDLRGRGRRRAVRVIYTGLAILFGLGLVGFGVGTGFGGGGLFSAATGNESGSGPSYSGEIKKYRKLTQRQPTNVAAWEYLTKALLHEAGGTEYVSESGVVSGKGRKLLKEVDRAWRSYLALKPTKPSSELAQLVVTHVYTEQALNEPAQAAQALQIVLETRRTSASLWAQLALYAYKAKNTRLGDLASEKSVSYASSTERTRLKTELAEAKSLALGGNSVKSYTTKTNGKTYTGHLGPNGTLNATQVTTTPAPAGTSTKKK